MLRHDRQFLYGKRYNKSFNKAAPDGAAVSPARNVAAIRAPLLLVHGKRDLRVPIAQSRDMAGVMRRAGKPVELIEQPEGDHNLTREADRLELLRATETFLAKHNPSD